MVWQSQCISCVSAAVSVWFKQIHRRTDNIHLKQLVQAERLKHTARLPYLQLPVHSELWSESAFRFAHGGRQQDHRWRQPWAFHQSPVALAAFLTAITCKAYPTVDADRVVWCMHAQVRNIGPCCVVPALLLQAPENSPFSTTLALLHTHNAAHTPKT